MQGRKQISTENWKFIVFHLGLMGQSKEKDMWCPTPWYSEGKSSHASGITVESHFPCYVQRRSWWLHCSLCDKDPELSKQSNSELGYLEFPTNCHSSISTTQRSSKLKWRFWGTKCILKCFWSHQQKCLHTKFLLWTFLLFIFYWFRPQDRDIQA